MSPSIPSAGPPRLRWRRIPGPPADPLKARLLRLYAALEQRFGPQGWWPGRTAYEIAAGAILAQFTSWRNAARAIDGLRARGLLSPRRLAAARGADLRQAVRPAGTYRVKARRLRAFTGWLIERFGGGFQGLRGAPLAPLRRDLLGVPGIGPETADAILLYAANRPVFVADGYARRVLARHALLPEGVSYEAARAFLEAHLPSDPGLFNEYHALLVAVGKTHCRATPRCEGCPLRFDLGQARRGKGRGRGSGRPGAPPRQARPAPARARPSAPAGRDRRGARGRRRPAPRA